MTVLIRSFKARLRIWLVTEKKKCYITEKEPAPVCLHCALNMLGLSH